MINDWNTRQMHFVLACPQANTERYFHMKLPNLFKTSTRDIYSHVLLLKRNLCGQKQAGRAWNQHLVKGLKKIGFQPLAVDECVFCKDDTMLFCYVDDGTFFGHNDLEINEFIKDIIQLKHIIEENCVIEDWIGINLERKEENTIKQSQPHLIQQIIDEINVFPRIVDTETPA